MSVPILSDIFGDKPEIADLQKFNLTDEQLKAILGNIENFPKIRELGNLFQDYALNQYERAIPGFKDILAKGGSTTLQMLGKAGEFLQGMVPKDVEQYVMRSTAFQNLMAGTMGSAMGTANMARNLGNTSLGMIQKGAELAGLAGNAALRWASASGAQSMSNMLLTPKEQYTFDLQQAVLQRNVQQQKNNAAASPNPIAKGLSDLVAYITASYVGRKPAGKPPDAPTTAGTETNFSGNIDQGTGLDSGGDGGGGIDTAQWDSSNLFDNTNSASPFNTAFSQTVGAPYLGSTQGQADYFSQLLYGMNFPQGDAATTATSAYPDQNPVTGTFNI